MNAKRILACFLIVLLAVIPVGCTGNSPVSFTSPATQPVSSASSAPVTDDPSAPAQETAATLLSDTPVTLKYLISERADGSVKNDWPTLLEIAKLTNVTIEFEPTPSAGYEEKKNILMATNSMPDLSSVTTLDGRNNGITGVFYDISDLIQSDAPHITKLFDDFADARVLATGADGGVYAIPAVSVSNGLSNVWLGRMDLVKEYGLEVPQTTEEFYEVLKVFKEKNPDSYPITTRIAVMSIVEVFTNMFVDVQGTVGVNPKTDRYEFSGYDPAFAEAVQYMNKLFSEELLDPEFVLAQSNQWEERLLNGKSYFTWDNRVRADQFTTKGQEINPAYDMDFIPLITAPAKEPALFANPEILPNTAIAVSSKTKHADVAVRFIDFLYSEQGAMLTNYGIEGVTYDIVEGKPVIRKEIGDNASGIDPAPTLRRDYGVVYDGFRFDTRPYQPQRSERYLKGSAMYTEYLLPSPTVIVDTEEEGERKKDMKVNLDKYFEQELTKFIMGSNEINEETINAFLEGCKKLKIDEYLALLNAQYEQAKG